ncbi:MAG: hypothetical protein ACI4E1_05765 [Lachnospira sp.]
MGAIIIVLGLGWLVYQLIKDVCITDVTKNQDIDFHQAYIDSVTGKCNGKELNKRMNNGYYNMNKK